MAPMPAPESTADARRRELDDQREQFHRELMRRSMRITELELELDELRTRYEQSLSWRLTKPLRIRGYLQRRRANTAG